MTRWIKIFCLILLAYPSPSLPLVPLAFFGPAGCQPGQITYTTVGGHTFNPPGTCDTMVIQAWGGGGGADGGTGRTPGSAGTASVVNGTVTANGGGGGAIGNGGAGGTGGTASGGEVNLSGTAGDAGTMDIGGAGGAAGGVSSGGGAGGPANDDGVNSPGIDGTAPGGGGAGGEAGAGNEGAGGGGGGGYAYAVITTTANISVTVGAGGAGGTGNQNGGAGGNGQVIISWGLDDIANTFDFTDLNGQTLSTLLTSDIQQVTGIAAGVSANAMVYGDGSPEMRICADNSCTSVRVNWTNVSQAVVNNEYVQLRMTSNAAGGATDVVNLKVGRTPLVDWSISTVDDIPDAFNFTDVNPAQPSTLYSSDIVQITGVSTAVSVSITGDGSPQYRTCSNSDCSSVVQNWTNSGGTISSGQYIQLRLTTGASYSQAHNVDITVGQSTVDWDVVNSADYEPNAINWADFNNTSSTETISGVAGPMNIQFSVAYVTGTPLVYYRKNGGAWVYFYPGSPASASFTNTDTIQFQILSGSSGDQADITVTNLSWFNATIDTVRGTTNVVTSCSPFTVTETAPGTTNHLVTPGCQFARVRAWGGGGGSGQNGSPPDGGAGGYAQKTFAVSQQQFLEVIVAQGGAGGGCAGSAGGTGAYAGGSGGASEAAGSAGAGGIAGGSGGTGIDKGKNGGQGRYGGGGGGGGDTARGGGGGGEETNAAGAGGAGCSGNGVNSTGDDSGGGGGAGACVGDITGNGSGRDPFNADLSGTSGYGGPGNNNCATGTGANGRVVLDVFGDDIYPNSFDFTDSSNVQLSTLTNSNIMQITGISVTANISVRGIGSPQYRTCSDAACSSEIQNWTNTPSTVVNGNYVQMRLTSSSVDSTARTAYLDVGYREEDWIVTTGDATPTAFNFTDSTGNSTSTQVSSDILQITGISIPTNVSISGTGSPQFRICSASDCSVEVVTWTNVANQISNNQYLQLRATSSGSTDATVNTNVTVGFGADIWALATYDTIPTAFNFTDEPSVTTSTLITSNILQITGIDTSVSVSVTGDGAPEFRTCSDAACSTEIQTWTTSPSTISTGQYVQLRMTSSASPSTLGTVGLTVGAGSDNWLVTTAP